MKTFFLLLCVHALTDFQLQNGAMHSHKSRSQGDPHWYVWLTAHAFICGGGVYVVTQSLGLALAETLIHFVIDYAKSDNRISAGTDQCLHILSRIVYAIL